MTFLDEDKWDICSVCLRPHLPPSLSSLKWECVIAALNGSWEKVNGFKTEKHNWASSGHKESCSGLQQHADEGVTMEENNLPQKRGKR